MQVYGGFAGTETLLSQRSWTANQTILSGANGGATSYHVVTATGVNGATLDGFTITGGAALSTAGGIDSYGGGMVSFPGTVTVQHCVITGNSAYFGGGGAFIEASAGAAQFSSDFFVGNSVTSTSATGIGGGAFINYGSTGAILTNCVFANNTCACLGGGAISNYIASSAASIINCTFEGNSVTGTAVASAIYYSSTTAGSSTLVNTVFWNNTGTGQTITSNSAITITATNCMIQDASLTGTVTLTAASSGNLFATNPKFLNTSLLAGADGIYGTTDDGLELTATSPGIDIGTSTGAPAIDIAQTPRPLGAGYDIGAYEYIPAVLYATATGSSHGLSWANPGSLSALLAVAVPGEQIWVKAGTYSPGSVATATFQLPTGVTVYGGFNGTETLVTQRNGGLNQTILSGGNLCYHVVTGANNATLTDFIITGGAAANYNYTDSQGGGGILCDGVSPVVYDCVFTGNSSTYGGGAAWVRNGATPTFRNCVFTANTSVFGGAIECEYNASPLIYNCTFSLNTGSYGGAIETFSAANPVLLNCILWGDTSSSSSEFYNNGTTPVITYSDIEGGSPVSGVGNLNVDPQFINTSSAIGPDALWMTYDDGLMLGNGSPCLTTGQLKTALIPDDILRSVRPLGGVPTACAMGAYESPTITVTPATQTASKGSTTTTPPVTSVDGTITLTRNGNTDLPLNATFMLGGTATSSDYAVPSANVTFVAGSATVTVPIDPVTTSVAGPSVTVVLTMVTATTAYEFSVTNTGTVTIANPNIPGVVLHPIGTFASSPDPTNALLTTTIQPGHASAVVSTFGVTLNSQPTQNVTVNLASSNLAEGTISPSTLTFTGSNWQTAQVVTVTGVNDPVDHGNGDQPYSIQTSGASSQDPVYNRIVSFSNLPAAQSSFTTTLPFIPQAALPANNWVVKQTVNSTSSFISPTTFSVTASGTSPATAIITLTTPAPAGATITIQYLNEASGLSGSKNYDTPIPFALFQGNDWVVSVGGVVQDPSKSGSQYTVVNDGSGNGEVQFTANTAGAVLIQADVVAAVNTDNYHKNFTVTPSGTLSLTEGSTSATYTVVLNSQPSSGTVVLDLAGANLANFSAYVASWGANFTTPTNISTNLSSLTFTASNWSVPQSVTVSAAHDFVIETPTAPATAYPAAVAQTVAASTTCPEYQSLPAPTVNLSVTDPDRAGVVMTPTVVTTSESDITNMVSQLVTVTLTSLPSAPVTVLISCVDPTTDPANDGGQLLGPGTVTSLNQQVGVYFTTEVTLSPFTYATWQTGQAVSLRGLRGTLGLSQSPNTTYTLNLAASPTTTDNAYSLVASGILANCTNKDIDTAGIIISQPQLTVTRGNTTGKTFTVQLASSMTPASGAYVELTFSDASGLLSISPSTVVFNQTTNPYNDPITVTVTAPGNSVVEPQTQATQITCAVVSNASGGSGGNSVSYDGLPVTPIDVTVLDTGTAGIAITPTAGLVTSESGGSASFQVSLLSRPAVAVNPVVDAPVTVSLASSNLGAGVLAQEFYSASTTANKVVFTSGTDLSTISATMLVQISGLGANNGAVTQITAVNSGSISISPPLKTYSGIEVIDVLPALSIAQAASDGVTAVLTFGGSPSFASIFEGQSVLLTAASPVCTATVSYVNAAAHQITLKNILLVGASQTTSALPLNSNQTAWFSTGPLSLTWPDGTWSTPRTVTVIGVHNQQVNGNVNYAIGASATSTDPHYCTSGSDSASSTDFDFPILYVAGGPWSVTQGGSPLSGYAISSNGNCTHVHFTSAVGGTGAVTLTYLPTSVSYTETTALTDFDYAIPYVAYNGSNWAVTQGSTTLSGFDITANAGYAHVHLAAPATAGTAVTLTYQPSVSLTNLDIDQAGYTVSAPSSPIIGYHEPATTTFYVTLTSEPVADVYLPVQSSNTGKGVLDLLTPSPLHFTQQTPNIVGGVALGWDQPHAVTIDAVLSLIADGTVPFTVDMLPANTLDGNYSSVAPPPSVDLATVDPNSAGIAISSDIAGDPINPPLVTNAQSGTQATQTFYIALTSQPLGQVTVNLSSTNTLKGTVSPTSVVFTSSTYSTPVPITVTAVGNTIVQGDVFYSITLQAQSTTDPNYTVLSPSSVQMEGQDNNHVGLVISDPTSTTGHVYNFTGATPDSPLQTTDLGGTVQFQVALTSQPAQPVSVVLASTDTTQGTPSPGTLTFDVSNWNTPQLVTVTGGNANNSDVGGAYDITLTVSSLDPFYTEPAPTTPPLYAGQLQASLTTPPTLDVEVPMINVAQNKQPTLNPISNITVNENQVSLPLIPLTGITTGEASENNPLSVTVTGNDNPALIASATPSYTYPSTTGTLAFTLQPNQFGLAHITVTVTSPGNAGNGGTKSVSQTFAITVNFVNQPPTFTSPSPAATSPPLLNQNQFESAVAQPIVVPGWATNISPGPANQSQETLTFSCTNSNNALFSVQPAVNPATGNLTYTIAPVSNGVANVTVLLQNSGGTANGGNNTSLPSTFSITVASVNQPPTITLGANIAVEEGAPAQTFTAWASNITVGPPDQVGQTLTITVTNSNNALFTASGQPAIDLLGNLTFTPNPQTASASPARGSAVVTVVVGNGGSTINGGVNSITSTFSIVVNPTIVPPVVSVSNQTTREVPIGANQVITTAMLSATDIDSTVRFPAEDPNLLFTITLVPGNGTLLLGATPLAVNSTFHQSDIVSGNLSYTHNGGTSQNDGFAFTVTNEGILAGTIAATPPLPNVSTPGTNAQGNLPASTSALQVFPITIDRSNPVVVLLPVGPLSYLDQSAPILIAPSATVSDPLANPSAPNASFTNGTITASFASGASLADVIGINTTGSFTVAGSIVKYNGAQFGTLNTVQGATGTVLRVSSLTDSATIPVVQAFISSLTYQNTAVSPSNPYVNGGVTTRVVQVVVADFYGDASQAATLAIAVTSVAHAPAFISSSQLITAENVPVSSQVVAQDVDIGQSLTYSVLGTPNLGTVVIDPSTGAFTFTPVANVVGSGGFTVQATDGVSETVSQAISVIISADSASDPFITSNPPMDTQQNDVVVYNIVGYSATTTPAFSIIGLDPTLYSLVVTGQTATLTLFATATANAGYVTFGILITDSTNNVSGFQPVTLLVEPTPGAGN